MDPRNETALSGLAEIATSSKRNGEAMSLYRRAITVNPNEAKYHALLGNVYLEVGLNSKALVSYERADELANHKEGWIRANIGNLLHNRGLSHTATQHLQRAIELSPGSTYAHDRLARAMKAADEEDGKERELLRQWEAEQIKPQISTRIQLVLAASPADSSQ